MGASLSEYSVMQHGRVKERPLEARRLCVYTCTSHPPIIVLTREGCHTWFYNGTCDGGQILKNFPFFLNHS